MLILCVAATGCARHAAAPQALSTDSRESDGCSGSGAAPGGGIAVENINPAIRPGDDFYRFVNHGWLTSQTLPPDRGVLGNFDLLSLQAEQDIATIVRRAASGADASPEGRQIGDLYNSFVDRERVEELGLGPLKADLSRIMGLGSLEEVALVMADIRSSTIAPMYVFLDAARPDRNLLHIDQNHLPHAIVGLPDRKAYSGQDPSHVSQRNAYRAYVETSLRNAGIERPEQRSKDVLALETRLAQLQWSPEQLRDRRANHHLLKRLDLPSYAPGFPWQKYLDARGVGQVDELVLGTDTAIQRQAALFASTSVEVWKSYLAFHWIDNHADYLPKRFSEARFELYGRRLRGISEPVPLDRRGVQFVNGRVKDLVGRRYAALRFSPQRREMVQEMISNIIRAFGDSLRGAAWMDEATRAEALRKLQSYKFKIGYPEQWTDYSPARISSGDLVGNHRRLLELEWDQMRSRLGGKASVFWYQSPQTVNASYNPLWNAIELPAAMLQAPFFDPCADPAVNYGAIGSIIAHEMAHAFDDQGSRFDSRGVLRDWWSGQSRERFDVATRALREQYSSFEPLPGMRLDGNRSIGENLADLIGVSVAHQAHRLHARNSGSGAGDAHSSDQRFFMGWAQAWRVVHTPAELRNMVTQGYHPPGEYRVNGAVRNIDAWYESFPVQKRDRLYLEPKDRVRLW
jgi:endothelin-converting enzyme/putative endopeptidase